MYQMAAAHACDSECNAGHFPCTPARRQERETILTEEESDDDTCYCCTTGGLAEVCLASPPMVCLADSFVQHSGSGDLSILLEEDLADVDAGGSTWLEGYMASRAALTQNGGFSDDDSDFEGNIPSVQPNYGPSGPITMYMDQTRTWNANFDQQAAASCSCLFCHCQPPTKPLVTSPQPPVVSIESMKAEIEQEEEERTEVEVEEEKGYTPDNESMAMCPPSDEELEEAVIASSTATPVLEESASTVEEEEKQEIVETSPVVRRWRHNPYAVNVLPYRHKAIQQAVAPYENYHQQSQQSVALAAGSRTSSVHHEVHHYQQQRENSHHQQQQSQQPQHPSYEVNKAAAWGHTPSVSNIVAQYDAAPHWQSQLQVQHTPSASPAHATAAPANAANPKTMCCYYKLQGWCKHGAQCWHAHSGEANTPCHYGEKCKKGHARLVRPVSPPVESPAATATASTASASGDVQRKPPRPAAPVGNAPALACPQCGRTGVVKTQAFPYWHPGTGKRVMATRGQCVACDSLFSLSM